MPTYLGPSDTFIVGNKSYERGDNIPLSKESLAHHRAAGHRFEGDPEPPAREPSLRLAPPTGPAAPAAATPTPNDDKK